MADVWLFLLAGASLVVLGFAAAQLFDRFRFPDYFILMSIGLLLGSGLVPLGGVDPRASLQAFAPLLTSIALAFILFEGGLVLHGRGMGRTWMPAIFHTALAMVLSILGMWILGTRFLGLSSETSLILGLAFCGPSATIVLSFLPRLGVTDRSRFTLTIEGVLGNVVAAVLVLLLVHVPANPTDVLAWVPYLLQVAGAVVVAFLVGEGWSRAVRGPNPRSFAFMTSVALAVLLYAAGEGFLGGNGGVAAFVFGLVLGYRRRQTTSSPEAAAARGLQEFHRELVFLLRTFFFLYLGLQVSVANLDVTAFVGAAAFTAVFFAARLPSVAVLSRVWTLPSLDSRILRATVARGMTDTVLILFAMEVGLIPSAESKLVTDLLFLVIVVAAFASAVLVFAAERTEQRKAAEVPAPVPASRQEELDRALAEFLDDPILSRGEVD